MSKRFKRVEEPKIEERFDYAEEVRKQIDRCLLAFSNDDGTIYNRKILENTVLALENMIPEKSGPATRRPGTTLIAISDGAGNYS